MSGASAPAVRGGDGELPLTGFVAASGGPGFGCGIRAGGHVQCWGSGPTPPAGEFSAVGVGGPSCGVRVDGSMACWGWRRARSEADEKLPWPPPGEFAALSSGDPMCGLRADGSLVCSVSTWGEDDDPTPDGAFVEVSVGTDYACGVRPSLSLECWGSNLAPLWSGGEIQGYADVGTARPPEGAFTAVAAGSRHACALDIAGEVVCWGSNWDSQLVGVPEGRFAAVIAGVESTCALRSDGSAVCWGGVRGEIEAATPEGRFVAISEGGRGFCGVRPGGDIECWWSRSRGWQGCLWLVLSFSPFEPHSCVVDNSGPDHGGVRVLPPEGDYVAVSARKGYTCGLLISGEARCWGLFFAGEAEPVAGPFTAISAGWFHACGLRPDGAVACWGNDDAWAQASPPGPFASLSAGWEYTCGLRPDGAVACWARQPGCAAWALIRRFRNDPWYPEECWDRIGSPAADAPAGSFTAVAAGAGHACALRAADGGVVCWGDNRFGQTEAPAGEFTALSAGFAHTCGLRPDDFATCWGNNNIGQATPPPGEFTEITAGEWHTCGLRPGGDAECWGQYTNATKRRGELVTPWASRHTMAWKDARPTPPPGPYTTLAAGNFGTCAIRADRSIDCWGH